MKAFEKQDASFDNLVKDKIKKILKNHPNAKNISEEKLALLADTEVIADACETMLKDSIIFEDIVQGNPSLAQKIKNALRDFINRLKEMLGSMKALTTEGAILEKCVDDLEQIQNLWDKAVTSGIKTLNATKSEQKNNTTNNSDVKYSLNRTFTENELNNNVFAVANMKPVSRLTGKEFEKSKIDLITQVEIYFDSIGNVVKSKYGNIELTRTGVKSSLGHGIGRNKAVAFKAIQNVINKGEIIDYQVNWKNRGYDTAVFAAPIIIADIEYYMAIVVIVEQSKNSYYLHEVVLQNKKGDTPFKTGTDKNGTPSGAPPSIFRLLQKIQNVNKDTTKFSMRDSKRQGTVLCLTLNNTPLF